MSLTLGEPAGAGEEGPRPTRFVVLRNTQPELKTTTIKSSLNWFPEALWGKFSWQPPFTHLVGAGDIDCDVIFLALDNEDDVKKLYTAAAPPRTASADGLGSPSSPPCRSWSTRSSTTRAGTSRRGGGDRPQHHRHPGGPRQSPGAEDAVSHPVINADRNFAGRVRDEFRRPD
jgi:hypothetical protein